MRSIKVLHTSDWHLGRMLHDKSREDEFDAFLEWLLQIIDSEKIDVLLISGDIFDTSNPTYSTQQRYYNFCTKLNQTYCKHAVITSGNHDSSLFIDVPSQILSCLNIHVIGKARFGIDKCGSPSDEIIVLRDESGDDYIIVAAVPFLADSDVRFSTAGEDTATKEQKVIDGVAEHYKKVGIAAEQIRANRDIPVIAMGHLYVTGGKIVEDDGVRTTYVGSLGGVHASIFGPEFDYVALGHLHVPQMVGGCESIRYAGSPLAMGFGESGQQKSVCIVEFTGRHHQVSLYPVPCFHKIAKIVGNKNEIEKQLKKFIDDGDEIYVSVIYKSDEYIDNLVGFIQDIIGDADYIKCLDTQNLYQPDKSNNNENKVQQIHLEDVTEQMVFNRLLDTKCPDIPTDERESLIKTFNELLTLTEQEL